MAKRRSFGSVRKLPSSKWQASYIDPAGQRQNAPVTFTRKRDAEVWLTNVEADLSRGAWVDPVVARQTTLAVYIGEYLDGDQIGDRWRETCQRNLRLHLAPLANLTLSEITPVVVRRWHTTALKGTGGKVSIAQSYRLLRAVMNQAVADEILVRNPCKIKGAGADRAAERPVATPEQVVALGEAINPRYRAAVYLAAWCSLRRGEITALHNSDVDLVNGTITISRNRVELLQSSTAYDKDPKTAAGNRTVKIPPHILDVLRQHSEEWAGKERFFVSRDGSPMRGDTIRQAFERARNRVGMPDFAFHDLRHTSQTLAASTGATLKDLMKRLGHASEAAAKRYLHTVDGRDDEIAEALSELAREGSAARLPKRLR